MTDIRSLLPTRFIGLEHALACAVQTTVGPLQLSGRRMHKKPNNKHAKMEIIKNGYNSGPLIVPTYVCITKLGKICDTGCENRCQALAVVFPIEPFKGALTPLLAAESLQSRDIKGACREVVWIELGREDRYEVFGWFVYRLAGLFKSYFSDWRNAAPIQKG